MLHHSKAHQHFAKHDSFIMSSRGKRKQEWIMPGWFLPASGYPSSMSCVFLSNWSESALVILAWGWGAKVNCDGCLILWPFSTTCSHWLYCPGRSLASAFTAQETGVEGRKYGFLWLYCTVSGLGFATALLDTELWHVLIGICFY